MAGVRLCGVAAAVLCGGAALGGTAGNDEGVRRQIDLALATIQFARCGPEKRCGPASPEEIADPPLTIAEAASVLNRGVVSAFARACAMDWIGESYQPMIGYWRKHAKSDRQIALIGILHGMALGQTEAEINGQACTDTLRRTVRAQLPRLP